MTRHDQGRRTVALALVATTAVQALVTMVTLTVSVMAPQLARELDVDPGMIGIYASLCYVGAMLGSLTAGGFVLRLGAIRFSQLLMIACALSLLICLHAHWSLFLLSALLTGLAYGPTTPASSHILARHTPAQFLSLSFSIKQTGVPLGGLLVGLLVPWLLTQLDWRGALTVVAVIVASASLLLQPVRARFDHDLQADAALLRGNIIGPLRLIFSRPELRLLAIATLFFSATQQCYIYFLVTFLETANGWENQQAGLALSILGAAAICGRIVWGRLADISGRSQSLLGLLALGMAATAAVTGLVTPSWPTWSVFALCAAFGATGASWNGVYLAEITRRVSAADVSRATGGGLFITFAGVVVAPPLFGLIIALTGGFAPAYFALAIAVGVIGLTLLRPVTECRVP
jgi:predicted MFS family arabinose efflux permease